MRESWSLGSVSPNNQKAIDLLLVADNRIEVGIFKRAMRKSGLSNRTWVATDGLIALDLLRAGRGGEGPPVPNIVMLDPNMPRWNVAGYLVKSSDNTAFLDTVRRLGD